MPSTRCCSKVGEFYDQEVEVTVNNLTALLEPLLTVVMGAMVGAMVICLYLPMFDYIKLVPNSGSERSPSVRDGRGDDLLVRPLGPGRRRAFHGASDRLPVHAVASKVIPSF